MGEQQEQTLDRAVRVRDMREWAKSWRPRGYAMEHHTQRSNNKISEAVNYVNYITFSNAVARLNTQEMRLGGKT